MRNKSFDRKSSYTRHLSRKNPCIKSEIRWQYCNKLFTRKYFLQQHQLKCNSLITPLKFCCDYCDNYFASKYSLERALLKKL